MLKKIVSVSLVIMIVIGAIFIFTPDEWDQNKVSADDYRGGWLLLPDGSDSTGVFTESTFTLKSLMDVGLEDVTKMLSIDGQEKPGIVSTAQNTFRITPAEPFAKNKLYTFRITRTPDPDITWTFQTSAPFMITGSLPSDKTTNVPIDTGIEIYFSHSEYRNPDKYFEISPSVEGRFQRHKNAYVFIPENPLDNGTLYTITVKKGVQTSDGNDSIQNDFVFSFETAVDQAQQQEINSKGYISFNKVLNEYSSEENPYLPIYYYFNSQNGAAQKYTVEGTVYAYQSVNTFLEALELKSKTPVWAYYSYLNDNFIDPKGLAKALTFENELQQSPKTAEDSYIKLPSSLPAGYYLIDCTWEDVRFQTFIQVTDIGIYMSADKDSMLVWLNDLKTDKPLANAEISLFQSSLPSWKTNEKGVAAFAYDDSAAAVLPGDSGERYFKIESADGRTAVLRRSVNQHNYYAYYEFYDMYRYNDVQNDYWNYVQLDRSLYKPDDTVFFWGFVKKRTGTEKLDNVTIEISQGNYYSNYSRKGWYCFPSFNNEPVAKKVIALNDGAFDGSIDLPYLEQGSYLLQVKIGNDILSSAYVTVQNYTKPAYKMEIEKDKKAIFWYEQAEFTIRTAFFEGTKLPGLDLQYNFNYYNGSSSNGSGKTDENGEYKVSILPGVRNDAQGEGWANFSGSAMLPESGQINAVDGLRVFANDINVAINAELSDAADLTRKSGRIDFKISNIVLDRINDGTAKNDSDFLGQPVLEKSLNGSVIENRWVRYRNGTYYDFINKKVMPQYRYELEKRTVATFSIVTDAKGEASYLFNEPALKDGYYTYEVTCTDQKSRTMKFDGYLGESWMYQNSYMDDNRYYLDGIKENYKDGTEVSLVYKKGLEVLPEASYLFIRSQNGIVDYTVTSESAYTFKMDETGMPNIFVNSVYFNGFTYIESGNNNIVYDYSEKELFIDAQTDKNSYKPGEEVVITLHAQDKDGKSVKAVVNAGIVDEALFALQDMSVTTLASLYEYVPTGIQSSYISHINSGMDFTSGTRNGMDLSHSSSASEEAQNPATDDGAQKDQSSKDAIRETFKDTALFETVVLDEDGNGEIRFTLPDNITAWRVTLTGISTSLDAGSSTETLIVSLPFFVNYSFNSTYLAGDQAYVGVSGYGNSLTAGDEITYKVSTSSNPSIVNIVKGKAFERVNVPVGTLTINDRFILIEAQTADGLKDSLKHPVEVKNSYHEISTSEYYDLLPGIRISGGTSGNTRLVFMDKGRGMFYPVLMSYIWQGGNRIDQQLPRMISEELLKTYFSSDDEYFKNESLKPSDYQTRDGGIAILPYGPSDLELTAKSTPFIKDTVDTSRLKQYLYTVYEDESIGGQKAAALYGLAVLREPVLLEIGKAAKINNASIKNLLYLCLAYCELGEEPQAQKLYDEKIKGLVERSGKFSWIDSGIDKDDVLETTALGLMLAARINSEDREGFYKYCLENRTSDILISMEILSYVKNQIERASPVTGRFTYTYLGETQEVVLEQGRTVSKDIPSKNINGFVIDKVEGDVALISIFKQPPTGLELPDSKISVSRSYYNLNGDKTTIFRQDEVVKVQISFEFDAKAIDGSYEITDFLPSGLKPIENTWVYAGTAGFSDAWYGRIDGQKSSFYVYHSDKYDYYQNKTITYYARVISTGTYTAESTIIQGVGNTAGISQGARETITIR
ncbi:MAG: Ig-like domain-containing alpha-2-macroglobulin family protein [Saccharofermentanales bacterium]